MRFACPGYGTVRRDDTGRTGRVMRPASRSSSVGDVGKCRGAVSGNCGLWVSLSLSAAVLSTATEFNGWMMKSASKPSRRWRNEPDPFAADEPSYSISCNYIWLADIPKISIRQGWSISHLESASLQSITKAKPLPFTPPTLGLQVRQKVCAGFATFVT